MFKGLKHTVECSKCGELTKVFDDIDKAITFENSDNKTECCNSSWKYIGLRPYYESILKISDEFKEHKSNATSINGKESNVLALPSNKIKSTNNETNGEELIKPGPRGVTNAQMIPAIRKAFKDNDRDLIIKLEDQYKDAFESAFKYLKKPEKIFVQGIIDL